MTREEDLIRSTTRAIASTVREVPPLQLSPVADELSALGHAPRGDRSGRRGLRPDRRGTWLVPLAAAAAVVALAVSLAVVRNLPGGSAAPRNSAASATGSTAGGMSTTSVDGAPRYYAALRPIGDPVTGTGRQDMVVGDSLTGKVLATFTPPTQSSFVIVRGAADDLTFVVEAVRSSTGKFGESLSADGGTLTTSWFEMRLAPGTAHPAQLTPLPVTPQSLVIPKPAKGAVPMVDGGEGTFPMALSQSGQELAIGDGAMVAGQTGVGVKVVSVATGRVLHNWTTADPSLSSIALGTATGLTWIDDDRALALAIVDTGHQPYWEEILRLNVTGPATGDLVADSQVISSAPESGSSPSCFRQDSWVPFVTAAGNTAACASVTKAGSLAERITFRTDTLTAGTPPVDQGKTDYQFTQSMKNLVPMWVDLSVQWANSSGDTLIGGWFSLTKATSLYNDQIGVISHGKFTPLRFPASFYQGTPAINVIASGEIAW